MPASYQRAVPLKMRRNFRNRKIASVPVKGPAFSDPKGRQALCRGKAASRVERHISGERPRKYIVRAALFSPGRTAPGVEGAPCAGGTQTRRRPERQRRLGAPACVYCAAARLRHASKHNCRVASPPITLRAAPIFSKWRKKPHRRVRSRQSENQM